MIDGSPIGKFKASFYLVDASTGPSIVIDGSVEIVDSKNVDAEGLQRGRRS